MWVLLSDGSAVNVDKLNVISIVGAGGKFYLEFYLNSTARRIKGSWNTEAEASAALVSITGAVDAAN